MRDLHSPEKTVWDLRSARVKTLLNEKNAWPQQNGLRLDGFVYDEISTEGLSDAEYQLGWLRRQSGIPFRSQPFDQLARAFHGMGLDDEAVKVNLAKNDEQGRQAKDIGEFLWYRVVGPFIQFGYRLTHVLYGSVFFVLLGFALFAYGKRAGIIIPAKIDAGESKSGKARTVPESYQKFGAFIYSLENFVPLVKLGVDEFWIPDANAGRSLRIGAIKLPMAGTWLRAYLCCHRLAGWLLTTLWVGSLSGIFKP